MRTGVHCSVRNGFVGALEEAAALGCETLQFFTQNPRGWMTRTYTDEEFVNFRKRRTELGLSPIVVHSPYLPNLCTSNSELYEKSLKSLIGDLDRCEKLGAEFLVLHPGAFSPEKTSEIGVLNLAKAINMAHKSVPGQARVLIENMAGGGRRLGSRFQEIADMLSQISDKDRIGVCWDTCHAHAAGYDMSNSIGVRKSLDEFDRLIGLNKIFVFHVNDSKGALGCHRDLHQHLGKGHVGTEGLKALFSESVFENCALVLETPKDDPDSDPTNLKTLRSLLPAFVSL